MHSEYAKHNGYACASADNVRAVSHLRAMRVKIDRMKEREGYLDEVASYLENFGKSIKKPEEKTE